MGSESISTSVSSVQYGVLGEDAIVKGRIGWKGYTRSDLRDHGPIVIGGSNVKSQRSLDLSDVKHISREKFDESPEIMLKEGDIVVVTRGNLADVALVDSSLGEATINPSIVIISEFNGDPAYLYYYLASQEGRSQLLSLSMGSSVPAIYQSHLKTITYPKVPVREQRRIAKILGDLDDKIELNRKMNETLEATARALFKSWFVDFDPVKAKMEERQPEGMDAETAALFPDKLVESELGMVPEGWEIGIVGDEFDVLMGQSPPGTTYNEDEIGLPFFQGSTDFSFRYPKRRVYTTDPKRIANHGDTLVSVRAPVGDINMAGEKCCIGRGLAAVRHKSDATSYTYHAMANLHPVFADYEAEGTVFGSISKTGLTGIRFIRPQPRIISLYESMIGSSDNEVRRREQESRTLATLRDALLPKLISGDLRVKDVEGYIERVDG